MGDAVGEVHVEKGRGEVLLLLFRFGICICICICICILGYGNHLDLVNDIRGIQIRQVEDLVLGILAPIVRSLPGHGQWCHLDPTMDLPMASMKADPSPNRLVLFKEYHLIVWSGCLKAFELLTQMVEWNCSHF